VPLPLPMPLPERMRAWIIRVGIEVTRATPVTSSAAKEPGVERRFAAFSTPGYGVIEASRV